MSPTNIPPGAEPAVVAHVTTDTQDNKKGYPAPPPGYPQAPPPYYPPGYPGQAPGPYVPQGVPPPPPGYYASQDPYGPGPHVMGYPAFIEHPTLSYEECVRERRAVLFGTMLLIFGIFFPLLWFIGAFLPCCYPRTRRVSAIATANAIAFIVSALLVILLPTFLSPSSSADQTRRMLLSSVDQLLPHSPARRLLMVGEQM